MAAPATDAFQLTAAVSDLTAWLIQQGLEDAPVEEWLEECCERLVAAGIPILRVNVTTRAHHPEIGAVAFRWFRGGESEQFEFQRTGTVGDDYRLSPLYYLLINGKRELRQRLDVPAPEHWFPIFDELVALGATDYLAMKRFFLGTDHDQPVDPSKGAEGMTISIVTDAPGGFSEVALRELRALIAPLSLTLKSAANRRMAEDISAAYLGRDASQRVLSGALRRGSCEAIPAVIWYFDLQGFTALSETLPGPDIIAMLNDYFAEAVDAVQSRGGNVLKFMGDGMLAIFNLDTMPDARAVAIEAAAALRDTVGQMNAARKAEGLPVTGFTLGLHAGDVLYGNIGGRTRLDFTVIGPAVNTTARILGMSGPVGQNIVISSAVAQPLREVRPDLVSLGAYRLRSVTERQELFTLD
ncbi:MAG: adenylate/guanylate cyclase domain-containing protein [Pseudomonadota bacterium]